MSGVARTPAPQRTVADGINASIGQGYVLTNPLQLAVMASRLASGRMLQPSLLADRVHRDAPALPFASEHLQLVREAMWGVVNGGGTGAAARMEVPGVAIAAKTGTAQVQAKRAKKDTRQIRGWSPGGDHAWFAGVAPAEQPEIAIVVLIEHGGAGGKVAGPVAKIILEGWAQKVRDRAAPDLPGGPFFGAFRQIYEQYTVQPQESR